MLNKSGGLTIPSELRREYNFMGGQAVDIVADDGRLVISQHTPRCLFCQGAEGVGKYMGRYVCRSCVEKMTQEVRLDG